MSTATDTELRDSVTEWKTALKALIDENTAIIGSAQFVDGPGGEKDRVLDVGAEGRAAKFVANNEQIKMLRSMVEGAETTLQGKEFLNAPAYDPLALAAMIAGAGGGAPNAKDVRSVGQMFTDSEEFKAMAGGEAMLTMRSPAQFKIADFAGRAFQRKDVYSAMPTGGSGSFPFGSVQRDPIVLKALRRTRVRDLFPIMQTNSPIIQFFRQTGFTNNASTVPERTADGTTYQLKPHTTISFAPEQTNVKTIAHWEAASRSVLADEPQLQGIIDTELLYGLQLVEDAQILSGRGIGEDLPGILNDDGIQTYSWSAGANAAANHVADNKADALRRAATKVMLAYYEATGVVVHDNDWEDIELTKDANGQYLLAVSIALGGDPKVWRLPVVSTPAMPEGTALVGAFGLGAQLYDREEASVRIAEQHADFFIRNGVVILAEERLGLAVKRPETFVDVTFDHAPT